MSNIYSIVNHILNFINIICFLIDSARFIIFLKILIESTSNALHNHLIQHYVIKFISDLRQVGGFLQVLWFPPPISLTTMIILLKVALNTINQTKPLYRIAGKLRRLQFSRCRCKRGVFNLSEDQISWHRVLGKNKIIVIIVSMLCK